MLENVFDLGSEIERESWVGVSHLAQDAQHVGRTVQEIRIAESNVARPHAYLLVHVGEDHVGGYGEKPAVVHRCDRAVQAGMQASPRSLGVAGGKQFHPGIQLGVPFQTG